MKKLMMLLILMVVVNSLFAGQPAEAGKMQIGLRANLNNYLAYFDENDYNGILSPGVDAFFDYKLFDNFAINMGVGYNQIKIDYPTVLTNNLLNATIKGKLFFIRTSKFNPFVNLGLGFFSFSQDDGYFTDSKTSSLVTLGVGAEIPINEKINFIASINHNITQDDLDHLPNKDTFLDDEFISASFGVSFKFGKAKEKEVVPEPIKIQKEVVPPPPPVEVVEEPVAVEEVVEEVEAVAVVEEPEPVVEVVEEPEPVVEFKSQVYMIKPFDSLIKIAKDIYQDNSMWKQIYKWNLDEIGEDPNLISPFNELLLNDVPAENYNELAYTFYNYEVTKSESLVDIAVEKYGNNMAWIIIYRDNKDILGENIKYPEVGTVLKLRDQIFNQE